MLDCCIGSQAPNAARTHQLAIFGYCPENSNSTGRNSLDNSSSDIGINLEILIGVAAELHILHSYHLISFLRRTVRLTNSVMVIRHSFQQIDCALAQDLNDPGCKLCIKSGTLLFSHTLPS